MEGSLLASHAATHNGVRQSFAIPDVHKADGSLNGVADSLDVDADIHGWKDETNWRDAKILSTTLKMPSFIS